MEANEMEPGTRDEGGQALREFQRAHHEMGGPIPVRRFELEDDLAGWGTAQSFVAQGRPRNVAAQTFEGVPLLGATARIDNSRISDGGACGLTLHRVLWYFPLQSKRPFKIPILKTTAQSDVVEEHCRKTSGIE